MNQNRLTGQLNDFPFKFIQLKKFCRKNIVLIILIIHGIGTLLPWNMFITADSYFNQKLTINEPIVNGTTITGTTTNGTIYKSVPYIKDLMNYITISSKLPNVVIQAVNFLIQPK